MQQPKHPHLFSSLKFLKARTIPNSIQGRTEALWVIKRMQFYLTVWWSWSGINNNTHHSCFASVSASARQWMRDLKHREPFTCKRGISQVLDLSSWLDLEFLKQALIIKSRDTWSPCIVSMCTYVLQMCDFIKMSKVCFFLIIFLLLLERGHT